MAKGVLTRLSFQHVQALKPLRHFAAGQGVSVNSGLYLPLLESESTQLDRSYTRSRWSPDDRFTQSRSSGAVHFGKFERQLTAEAA